MEPVASLHRRRTVESSNSRLEKMKEKHKMRTCENRNAAVERSWKLLYDRMKNHLRSKYGGVCWFVFCICLALVAVHCLLILIYHFNIDNLNRWKAMHNIHEDVLRMRHTAFVYWWIVAPVRRGTETFRRPVQGRWHFA